MVLKEHALPVTRDEVVIVKMLRGLCAPVAKLRVNFGEDQKAILFCLLIGGKRVVFKQEEDDRRRQLIKTGSKRNTHVKSNMQLSHT